MQKFATFCILDCLWTFADLCKCSYDLTPELLGVKYQDTCHSIKCSEISYATILIWGPRWHSG